jgi:tRNA1Val (adenine37-N6)-methyltransferase
MCAQKYPAIHISAIEMEHEIAGQAYANVSASVFQKQIQIIQADFFEHEFSEHFDLILCNPPYYKKHLQGMAKEKNTAMHNQSMPLELLAQKTASLLTDDGSFWCILPKHEMTEMIGACEQNGLWVQREIAIFNKPGKYFRTISCFTKQGKTLSKTQESLLICEANGVRTDAFQKLMVDFYLENTEIYKRKQSG